MSKPEGSTKDRALMAARNYLGSFIALNWRRFAHPRHIEVLIDRLEAVDRGEINRLMVFMPPRHGKSETTSAWFPAWYLGRHPDRSIIAVSYGAELATGFGRRVRNTIVSDSYRRVFPDARIAMDSNAVNRFNLTSGGAYYALGAGGPITGRGADLLLIDDPIKNREEAFSATSRRALQEWFQYAAYSRLEPSGAVILVQTRWHEDDLAGWLLRENAEDGWVVVSLPAVAEAEGGGARKELRYGRSGFRLRF